MTYKKSLKRFEKRLNKMDESLNNRSFNKAIIKLIEAIYLSEDEIIPLESLVSNESFMDIKDGRIDFDLHAKDIIILLNYYRIKFKFKPNKIVRNDIRNMIALSPSLSYNEDRNSHGGGAKSDIISFCKDNNLKADVFILMYGFLTNSTTILSVEYPKYYKALNDKNDEFYPVLHSILQGDLNLSYLTKYTKICADFGYDLSNHYH